MKHDPTHDEAAPERVIPRHEAVSATRHVYPRPVYPWLMIGGVDRTSFASGLAVYALPGCAASISRHRARVRLRRARQALSQIITPSGADMCPRHQDP